MSKNCPQDTFTTLAEKHLLLKSVVPGINIRRMTHYNYLLAKDQLKQQVRKKNGERIGSVVPGMRGEEKGTLPALGEKNRLVAMGEGGFGARKRSVPSFWPKKLNDSSIRHSPQYRQEMKEKLQRLDTESLNLKKQALEADIKNLRDELVQRQELLAFIDELIDQKQQS